MNQTALKINEVLRRDPTFTLTLRNVFEREMSKRFRELRGLIRTSIVTNDCFGLKGQSRPPLVSLQAAAPGAFAFTRTADKVDGFMDWLDDQVQGGVLEKTTRPGLAGRLTGAPAWAQTLIRPIRSEEYWTDKYVKKAYAKGVIRAESELKKVGVELESAGGGIAAVMNQPFHADRVGLLYTRAFRDLKGITDTMDSQLSRILGEGLARGEYPLDIAKKLNRTISGPTGDLGIHDTLGRFIPAERRAKMLARTEVIRAHHVANVNTFRQAGIEGVEVQAEWGTAGWNVCPKCQDLEGKTFTLDEIEPMIPRHPHCRCVAIPKVGEPPPPGPQQRAPQPEPLNIAVGGLSLVSQGFGSFLTRTVDQLPKRTKELFKEADVTIEAREWVSDWKPDMMRGVRPRGWPQGTSWEMAGGVYDTQADVSVIAEKVLGWNGQEKRQLQKVKRGILLHETGHQIDKWGKFSDKLEYQKARDADISRMQGHDKMILSYELQPGAAGREETFAEVFANINGGSCTFKIPPKEYREKWPNTKAYILKNVLKVGAKK